MHKIRVERWAKKGSFPLLLIVLPVLFPGILAIVGTVRDIPDTLRHILGSSGEHYRIFEAGSGTHGLPREVQISARMLKDHGARDYHCSPKILTQYRGTGRYQRLMEGVYPVRYSDASAFVFVDVDEDVGANCRDLETEDGVRIVFCGS